MHYYHAFGLKLASKLRLPELHAGSGPPDVTVRCTWYDVEKQCDPAPAMMIEGKAVIFNLEGIRFKVSDGMTIDIHAPEGKEENDIRVWLLGTVMAGLLHQRGYLPLHANTVQLPSGGAAAFAGPSGAGKSTLAALLEEANFRVLGDDLCAIKFDRSGHPMIFAGVPRLKLWGETLDILGHERAGLERVATDLVKYHVPLASASEVGPLEPLSLERIYILDRQRGPNEPLISRLGGAMAAGEILDNAFRWSVGQIIRGPDSRVQFDQCLAVARTAAVFKLARRWGTEQLAHEGREIARALVSPLVNSETAFFATP